ncbi:MULTISPECIES: cytidine deaminase [unclassified Flavobacterium]|uniref:cytidine deaminase n=1 Tax=unclassified Flavobacterium TaxID=196869 RepID=UPI001F12FF8A|nr:MULTISPECIES: cytidine deaminase [unclassified Flavobacterium]UMY67051.1 cytidine deaminase [Flavobacterium sp. HJ-32-4]
MKHIDVTARFDVYDSIGETPVDIQNLMARAVEARRGAYAPYSNFRVGVALLLDNGQVLIGSNQENAAYPSGLCAERVAVFQSGAVYPDARILKMAITAASDHNPTTEPIPPCGACRQSIAEYELRHGQDIEIWFMGETGVVCKSASLKNLLPFTFDRNFL